MNKEEIQARLKVIAEEIKKLKNEEIQLRFKHNTEKDE